MATEKTQKLLSGISGNISISSTTKYNLGNYNEYLRAMRNDAVGIQTDIKNVAKAINDTVMKKGVWYDGCAAEFAVWWNDVKGQRDGIDRLNNISTYLENFIRIGSYELSKAIWTNKNTASPAKGYKWIEKYATSTDGPYTWGFVNISKAGKTHGLGKIEATKCANGVALIAVDAKIKTMAKNVGTALDDIDTRIDRIKKRIQKQLIDGESIKIKDLDTSTLNRYVNSVKLQLDAIQDELYARMLEDSRIQRKTIDQIKKSLKQDFGVK